MSEVDVIIEISMGSHVKYEYDKERNIIVCDRILRTPMKYPCNYGFVPNTLSEDGEPLDVVVIMGDQLIPCCLIRCEILGYLDTKHDKGFDPKLIVRPISKVDHTLSHVNDILKITPDHMLRKIEYFFKHYNELEHKVVEVGQFHDKKDAIKLLNDSITSFIKMHCQKNKITNYFKRI